METLNKPELNLLKSGSSLKTLQISASSGMVMPLHHATKEAVIVIQEGEALLKMSDSEQQLTKGMTYIIPALVNHSLEIKKDFKAIAIMAVDSDIAFQKY